MLGTQKQEQRFGSRVSIAVPASLEVGTAVVDGSISDVGLGGARFSHAGEEIPVGRRATLHRDGGRGVPVVIVWTARDAVGLAFDRA